MDTSRRGFLKTIGSALSYGALRQIGISTAASMYAVSGGFRVWQNNGTAYLEIPPSKGASFTSIARNILGDINKASYVAAWNENKSAERFPMEVRLDMVTPELRESLNEELIKVPVGGEEGDKWLLSQFSEEMLDIGKWGLERTQHLISALNGINDDNPYVPAGLPLTVPASLAVVACRNVNRDHRTISIYQPRFRDKSAPGRRRARTDAQLIENMGRYVPPIPVTYQYVRDNLLDCDKFGAYRKAGAGKKHGGLDVYCPIGTPLVPIEVGRITEIRNYAGSGYWRNGRVVSFITPSELEIRYLHLRGFRSGLKVGDVVDVDTIIGYAGISGNGSSNNPHVHVQIKTRRGGGPMVDPLPYVLGAKNDVLQADVRRNRNGYLGFYRTVDRNAL